MELSDLFKNQDWTHSTQKMNEVEISKAMKSNVEMNVKTLFNTYYKSIFLNSFFLASVWLVYFYKPTLEVLFPVLLISACFAIIIINVAWQLINEKPIDTSKDLKTVLTKTLAFNTEIYKRQCRYNSFILTSSFLGGFLLGIVLQGWTFQKFIDKPIIIPIIVLLTLGFHFLAKTKLLKKVNSALNPKYHKAKAFLEEQLKYLEENS